MSEVVHETAAAAMPRIARPQTAAEVAAVLADCAAEGVAAVPFGDGLALDACGPGTHSARDTALLLEGVTGIVAFEPDDLTITARAGTPLAEITKTIAERRLMLPGATHENGTLGGLLACGWNAPAAIATHGRLRDRVLGMEVASPSGHCTRSGGRVVKNVAGLDLHRMHTGACGAFGVITEACLRLEPMPEAVVASVLTCASASVAQEAWRALRREGPEASALAVRLGDGARVVVVFAGDDETVRDAQVRLTNVWRGHGSIHELDSGSADAGEALHGPLHAPRAGLSLTISVRPSQAIERLAALHANAGALTLDAVAYPDLGVLHVAAGGPRDALGNLWEATARGAIAGEGHFRIETLPAGLLRSTPAWSGDPSALRLLARLKRAFDPAGTIRPGSWSAAALEAAADYFAGGAR